MDTRKQNRRRRGQAGFTLVELMVVIAIIAMLAAIVGYNVFSALNTASAGTAKAQIDSFKTAIVSYRIKNKKMPATLEDLKEQLSGPVPADPWGNKYVYTVQGGKYTIVSYGEDGAPGGGDDISSDDLGAEPQSQSN